MTLLFCGFWEGSRVSWPSLFCFFRFIPFLPLLRRSFGFTHVASTIAKKRGLGAVSLDDLRLQYILSSTISGVENTWAMLSKVACLACLLVVVAAVESEVGPCEKPAMLKAVKQMAPDCIDACPVICPKLNTLIMTALIGIDPTSQAPLLLFFFWGGGLWQGNDIKQHIFSEKFRRSRRRKLGGSVTRVKMVVFSSNKIIQVPSCQLPANKSPIPRCAMLLMFGFAWIDHHAECCWLQPPAMTSSLCRRTKPSSERLVICLQHLQLQLVFFGAPTKNWNTPNGWFVKHR